MRRDTIVEDVIHQFRYLPTGFKSDSIYPFNNKDITLAVSGGIDSMVMMYIASRIKDLNFSVVHINHNIRPQNEHDKDRDLVYDYAQKLNMPIVIGDVFPKSLGGNLEANAREERYKYIQTIVKREGLLATAHHADDNLATRLIRLCQGRYPSGIEDVVWIKCMRVIRPMLSITKEQIKDLAAKRNIPYRYDITNDDLSLLRNRVNNTILPLVQQIQKEHGRE